MEPQETSSVMRDDQSQTALARVSVICSSHTHTTGTFNIYYEMLESGAFRR